MAQELLATFAEEIGSVVLTPDASGGRFEIYVKNQRIWSRQEQGGFPEMKEIKQLVRDRIAPGRTAMFALTDAWMNEFKYVPQKDGHFQLVSAGPDKAFGTSDDIQETF